MCNNISRTTAVTRYFVFIICIISIDSIATSVLAATKQNFDVVNQGSSYILGQFGNPPGPELENGGPTQEGIFLRMGRGSDPDGQPSLNISTIDFDLTDTGPHDQIVVDFDFYMEPRNGRADGFGFALLNTEPHGTTGASLAQFSLEEEPNFTDSLGVGFDLYQNTDLGDIGQPNIRANFSNSISIHYNGVVVHQADATLIADLARGEWIHARIIMRPGGSFSDVSVILTPCEGSSFTVVDQFQVPGFVPHEGRIHFGTRSGGDTASYALDNVRAQFLDLSQAVISFKSLNFYRYENQLSATLAVTRTGDLNQTVSVDYSTSDGTALAGTDYVATSGTLVFAPGITANSFVVPIIDDTVDENDERFKVSLLGPLTGRAKRANPKTAIVNVFDDERSSSLGHWSKLQCLPIVPIHLHVLPTAKVMFWDRLGNVRLWDSTTNVIDLPAKPDYNIFCSGHSFLPDGRLLVTGGHADDGGSPALDGVGRAEASIYDPSSNTWDNTVPNMNAGRWYPTNTPLYNGETLVLSGTFDINYTKNTLPQVWQFTNRTWRDLVTADDLLSLGVDLYPRMFQAPDGKAFKAGPDSDTWFLDTSNSGAWSPGPMANFTEPRSYGIAAMYDDDKILVAGGGNPPTNSVEVIDLSTVAPTWRPVAPMFHPRRQHNATVLPDGRVLVTGGSSGSGFSNGTAAVLAGEIWDPDTETWTTLPSMKVARLYHSTAILLPNGRVMVAGGGQGANITNFHSDMEIYSPSYLFRGPRPSITSVSNVIGYGRQFLIDTPDSNSIEQVSLIRLPSVTHSFSQGQSFRKLDFQSAPGNLLVSAPPDARLAPPGHYMLFILDDAGVPSKARIIQLQ